MNYFIGCTLSLHFSALAVSTSMFPRVGSCRAVLQALWGWLIFVLVCVLLLNTLLLLRKDSCVWAAINTFSVQDSWCWQPAWLFPSSSKPLHSCSLSLWTCRHQGSIPAQSQPYLLVECPSCLCWSCSLEHRIRCRAQWTYAPSSVESWCSSGNALRMYIMSALRFLIHFNISLSPGLLTKDVFGKVAPWSDS